MSCGAGALAGNITAGLRSLVGGEIHEYTEFLNQSRGQALDRLREHAQEAGCQCSGQREFDSSEIGQTMTELLAYGTGCSGGEGHDAGQPGEARLEDTGIAGHSNERGVPPTDFGTGLARDLIIRDGGLPPSRERMTRPSCPPVSVCEKDEWSWPGVKTP